MSFFFSVSMVVWADFLSVQIRLPVPAVFDVWLMWLCNEGQLASL